MIRTVDLVVAGAGPAALAAAAAALGQGRRVLVLLPAHDPGAARRLRRRLGAPSRLRGRLHVLRHADVVCVDGVGGVEVVVVRDTRSGRLSAVNASTFLADGTPAEA